MLSRDFDFLSDALGLIGYFLSLNQKDLLFLLPPLRMNFRFWLRFLCRFLCFTSATFVFRLFLSFTSELVILSFCAVAEGNLLTLPICDRPLFQCVVVLFGEADTFGSYHYSRIPAFVPMSFSSNARHLSPGYPHHCRWSYDLVFRRCGKDGTFTFRLVLAPTSDLVFLPPRMFPRMD